MRYLKINLDLFPEEGEVLDEDLDIGEDDLDIETDALAEETGEAEISDEVAGDLAGEAEATENKISVSVTDIPQLENLQAGDELDLITTYRVLRGDGDTFDLEPIDYIPAEDIEPPEEAGLEAPAPAPAQAEAPAQGGGLGGLL